MASWIIRFLGPSLLVILVLRIATITDASVTWRRVARPTLRPASAPLTESTTTSTTKSPITWKRSTIARRSTAAVERKEQHADEDESDEIELAGSRQDEYVADEEFEGDSEVKPLVPGSRPGFWFDSARRRKPSTLLRPGTRRNSLFPNRTSTTTTPAPTTVNVTPLTVIPRTLPSTSISNAKNSSTRHFGSNRSTKSPVAFRRRKKTTRTPNISSTVPSTEVDIKGNNLLIDSGNPSDNGLNFEEEKNLQKQLQRNENETETLIQKSPALSNRRQYNGTRLSWTRQNSRYNSKTTSVRQQLTTISTTRPSSTQDYESSSIKTTISPRGRKRYKIRTSLAPDITWSRTRQSTQRSSTKSNKKIPIEVTTSSSATEQSDIPEPVHQNESLRINSNEDNDDSSGKNTDHIAKDDLIQFNQKSKSKSRTTVEPFFITRDYGQIVTEVPELKSEKKIVASAVSEPKPNKERITEQPKLRKDKSRTRIKVTETPKISSTVNAEIQDSELEYDDSSDAISSEDIEEHKSRHTSAKIIPPPKNSERYSEKLQAAPEPTTTVRSVTRPNIPTINPSSDAYVVWSLGQGGSGWSYQKHGSAVKWSAQNSEAEGDRWSIVSKDEEANIEADLNQWMPIRNNSTLDNQNSNTVTSKSSDNQLLYSSKSKGNAENNASSSSIFVPKLSYNNETLQYIKTANGDSGLSYQHYNTSFPQISSVYLPSSASSGTKSTASFNYSANLGSFSQSATQEPQSYSYVSQTPLPVSPTLEAKFNEQIKGIIYQYPIVPNYPYMAEIRDAYSNIPDVANFPTTKLFEVQEYITQSLNDRAKESTTPIPFPQELQTNPYPTEVSQYETVPSSDRENSETPISNHYSSDVNLRSKYLSAIPPELAKAVVEEKKWNVVGSGGDDGWSLLDEDGVLEWKIHNVDGKWRVTSAEQLLNTAEPQQSTFTTSQEKPTYENYGYSNPVKQDPPKVWTLEDDYAKWRSVSAEQGSPIDASSEEKSATSEEYDYDSYEYQNDYYSNDNYYKPVVVTTRINSNEDFGDRPLWGDGENHMIQNNPKNDYTQFAGNIEFANSKEDAIDSWKSLIAEEGHWKMSGVINNRYTHSTEDQNYHQNVNKNAERRISTPSSILSDDENKRQKNEQNEVVKETYETAQKSTGNLYKNNEQYQSEAAQPHVPLENERGKHTNYETVKTYEPILKSADDQREQEQNQFKEINQFHKSENKQTAESNIEKLSQPRIRIRGKDYSKLDSLINKLEVIQKESKGRAVVDLTALLKNIKARRNVTSVTSSGIRNLNFEQGQSNVEHSFTPNRENQNINNLQRRIPSSNKEREDLERDTRNYESRPSNDEINFNSYNENKKHSQENSRVSDHRLRHSKPTEEKRRKRPRNRTLNKKMANVSSKNFTSLNPKDTIYPPARTIERYSRERHGITDLPETKVSPVRERSSVPQNRFSSYLETPKFVDESESDISTRKHPEVNHNVPYSFPGQKRVVPHSNFPTFFQKPELSDRSDSSSSREYPEIKHYVPHSQPRSKSSVRQNNYLSYFKKPELAYKSESGSSSSEEHPGVKRNVLYSQPGKNSNVRHNNYPNYLQKPEIVRRPEESDTYKSEEIIVDLRDQNQKESVATSRHKRPTRKSRRPHHSAPIVLKGETELPDGENGSKKSRKIIVIDYAGMQKRKSSVDKKDLELIIRNVKHRRSELLQDNSGNEN